MIAQGTPEWDALRLGKATASHASDIMAKTKSGPAASRQNYLAQLVAERLTGNKADFYSNGAMQWGNEKEPDARNLYSFMKGAEVQEVSFVDHPRIPMTGASPDGLVGDDGLVEIKCPNTATHIDTLQGGPIKRDYLLQMQWQMACTGRKWCDFVSYDPRMPAQMQIHIQRVNRDDILIAEMEREISSFLAEVKATVDDLTAKYLEKAA